MAESNGKPPVLEYESSPPKYHHLRAIAERQRVRSWCGILYLIFFFTWVLLEDVRGENYTLMDLGGIPVAGAVVTAILTCVSAWRLCRAVYRPRNALAMGAIILFSIIVPYVAVVPLALVHSRASKILRQHGLKVGFIGADLDQLAEIAW